MASALLSEAEVNACILAVKYMIGKRKQTEPEKALLEKLRALAKEAREREAAQ